MLFEIQQNSIENENYNVESFVKSKQYDLGKETIQEIRRKAQIKNKETQEYNKKITDKKRIKCTDYKEGDFVVLKANEAHKLDAKFKGPYQIKKVLPNDRFVITDIDGFQVSSIPFNSICSPNNIRKWMCNDVPDDESIDEDISFVGMPEVVVNDINVFDQGRHRQ